MNFHLDLQVKSFPKKLHYREALFFMGSCFAENIALQMQEHKFQSVVNPHGVLYNPHSIAAAIRSYLKNKTYTERDIFYAGDCYHSWEHHSRFSNTDAVTCLSKINQEISMAHDTLKSAGWLFITFGSAYSYKHKKNDQRIANCHKQPLQDFTKELLTIDEMVKEYRQLITELKQYNPQLKIVFTVSPVRYIRDGVIENNRSKARLIETVHQLTNEENVFYFPAYELVTDDLRDYCFYKSDLVHPNEQAIDYVFEKFVHALFDQPTREVFEKIKDIVNAKAHRPLQENSTSHQQFKSAYLNRCKQLQKEFPFLILKEELTHFGKGN